MLALRVVLLALMFVLLGSALGWYELPGLAGRRHWIPWLILGLFIFSLVVRLSRRAAPRDDDAVRR